MRGEVSAVSDLKEELHRKLQASRAMLLSKLDDLSEYDRRRPMTSTGANLLGLVKHLAGLEYGYLPGPGEHVMDRGWLDLAGRRHVGQAR
jgi:hypothetical protein